MFVAQSVIKADIAGALKVAAGDLPDWWDDVIPRHHLAAYQEIVGALVKRGYTKAQVDDWDRGAEFERSIALYFAFSSPQGQGTFDVNTIKLWDKRPDLKDVQVYIDDEPVKPGEAAGATGQVGSGTRTGEDADPVFNFFDSENPSRW